MRVSHSTLPSPATAALLWIVQWIYSAAAIAAIALFGAGTVLAGFEVLYRDRIFPGVKVGAADLSEMTQAEAAGALSRALTYAGDVSLDTGYAEALIIYAGQTIQGVGGGICQVSTTAFRAAFFGGFPIVDRSPHAYRVQWYESTFGPGLDATVFAPQVDFKFRNDMNTWVLMEAWVYPHGELQFKLYGTSDGRVVEVNPPEITNVIQPEPDLYEEDASIPPGEVKQVEWAAAGGDVIVTRTVTSVSGSVLYQDNIRTRYQPWRAVYKVAPGELPPPVPEP